MRLIIAGTRTFSDYELLKSSLDKILSKYTGDIEVISGTCRGVDKLGEKYAKEKNYKLTFFPAHWDLEGKAAGFKRNRQMAEIASHCVVFWDGSSKGAKLMIDLAKEYNIPLRIIYY